MIPFSCHWSTTTSCASQWFWRSWANRWGAWSRISSCPSNFNGGRTSSTRKGFNFSGFGQTWLELARSQSAYIIPVCQIIIFSVCSRKRKKRKVHLKTRPCQKSLQETMNWAFTPKKWVKKLRNLCWTTSDSLQNGHLSPRKSKKLTLTRQHFFKEWWTVYRRELVNFTL